LLDFVQVKVPQKPSGLNLFCTFVVTVPVDDTFTVVFASAVQAAVRAMSVGAAIRLLSVYGAAHEEPTSAKLLNALQTWDDGPSTELRPSSSD
jgi:hypothetical protein